MRLLFRFDKGLFFFFFLAFDCDFDCEVTSICF